MKTCTLALLIPLGLISGGLPAQTLPRLPVQNYDYRVTANILSPISLGMGGINLTNAADYFISYDNPALLAGNNATAFATSFRLANNENMNLTEVLSASNLLKEKQFMYYTLITKNAAWSYHPVASVNVSERTAHGAMYYDYQLDKLQLSLASTDARYTRLAGGLNVKYLTGRLIYLKERISGNNLIREDFIDNKVKGVSADLGFTWDDDKFTWGVCVYDIFSRLWWEDYDSESLQRRAALGFQYTGDNIALLASVQGKVSSSPAATYHFGLIRNWVWQTKTRAHTAAEQNLVLRAGMFSRDFHGTDNIYYTLGSGYNYNMFRIDFAITNKGMRLKDSQYLFSVGIGI